MTEYELLDSFTSYLGLASNSQSLIISIVSAYIVIAYYVGKKLTSFQISLITLFFGISTTVALQALTAQYMRALEIVTRLQSISAETIPTLNFTSVVTIFVVNVIFIVIGLLFMFQTRYSR